MRKLHVAVLLSSICLATSGCVTQSMTAPMSGPASTPRYFADAVPDPKPAAVPVPASPASAPSKSVENSIRDIRDAKDIDAALDAYSTGMAIDSSSTELHRAYLRKMVDLDAPKIAEDAARQVLAVDPGNGLARAVLADSEAKQGLMVDALTDIGLAARRAPAEPFVQRTSARLLAWNDHNPQPPKLPPSVQTSLANARKSLEDSPAYVAAYKDAAYYFNANQNRADSAVTQGSKPETTFNDRTDANPAVADRIPDLSGCRTGGLSRLPIQSLLALSLLQIF